MAMFSNFWFFTSRVLIGTIIGIGILSTPLFTSTPQSQEDLFALVPPPQSLDELLNRATLIFIGEVGPLKQCLSMGSYDWDGKVNAAHVDCANPQKWSGVPVTDFKLAIDEVLRDDGTVAAGDPIVLRTIGFATAERKQETQDSEFPLGYIGDRHLFLLGRNPDGTYGISYGTWSRLIIDGESLRISNGKGDPLRFKENDKAITLEEFRAAIRKANADVSSTPGTDPAVTNTTK